MGNFYSNLLSYVGRNETKFLKAIVLGFIFITMFNVGYDVGKNLTLF